MIAPRQADRIGKRETEEEEEKGCGPVGVHSPVSTSTIDYWLGGKGGGDTATSHSSAAIS